MATTSFTVKKGIIYPISDIKNISPEKIVITPPYEDEGVKFSGYSKRLIKNNEYKIFPQQPFYKRELIIASSSGTKTSTFSAISYLKQIIVSHQDFTEDATDGQSFTFYFLNDNNLIFANIYINAPQKTFIISFDVPIKIVGNAIYCDYTSTYASDFSIFYYGWRDLI